MNGYYCKHYTGDFIANGKASGLIDYLNYLIEQNLISESIGYNVRLSVKTVFEVVEESAQCGDIDIKSINVESCIAKFNNQTKGKYTDRSNRIYISNFKRAIKWYKQFLSDPSWNPTVSVRATKRTPEMKAEPKILLNRNPLKNTVITHPILLSSREIATFESPLLITAEDASRIIEYINSLVVKETCT